MTPKHLLTLCLILFFGLAVTWLPSCGGSKSNPTSPSAPPANTSTFTITHTTSYTPTNSATRTPSSTPSNSPTVTPTPTITNTATPSPTPTITNTPTNSPTPTDSSTPTNTPTVTPTPTITDTATDSPTPTITNTPTNSPTVTVTNTPTDTPTVTDTPTITATPTATTCSNYGLTDYNFSNGSTMQAYYYTNQVGVGAPTTMQSLNVWGYDGNTTTSETIYLALYDAGTGDQLAYGSFALQRSDTGTLGALQTVTLGSPVPLAAGTYDMVICVPTGSTHFYIGASNYGAYLDYGTYSGGTPPANYSSFTSLFGGFHLVMADNLYFQACP